MLATNWHPVAQPGYGDGGVIVSAFLLALVIWGYFKMKG